MYTGHAQVKNDNKTRQIEQLQQLKENITRTIDTLHLQLAEQADSMQELQKKLGQAKKDTGNQPAHATATTDQAAKLPLEQLTATAACLQKKFDQRLAALDKAVNLQRDLEDKINTLVKASNR